MTMRVKLLTPMVGNHIKDGKFAGHFAYGKGDEIEMLIDEAKRYIAKGYAVAVNEKPSK